MVPELGFPSWMALYNKTSTLPQGFFLTHHSIITFFFFNYNACCENNNYELLRFFGRLVVSLFEFSIGNMYVI